MTIGNFNPLPIQHATSHIDRRPGRRTVVSASANHAGIAPVPVGRPLNLMPWPANTTPECEPNRRSGRWNVARHFSTKYL